MTKGRLEAFSDAVIAIIFTVMVLEFVLFYGIAIGLALVSPMIAFAIYVLVAVMWLVPDRRMARVLTDEHTPA